MTKTAQGIDPYWPYKGKTFNLTEKLKGIEINHAASFVGELVSKKKHRRIQQEATGLLYQYNPIAERESSLRFAHTVLENLLYGYRYKSRQATWETEKKNAHTIISLAKLQSELFDWLNAAENDEELIKRVDEILEQASIWYTEQYNSSPRPLLINPLTADPEHYH